MLGIGESGASEGVDHAEKHEELGGLVEQDREQVEGTEGLLVRTVEEEVGREVVG